MKPNQKLTFIALLRSRNATLLIPLMIGLVASIAAVSLLAVSGWFITAAGLAGLLGVTATFNFFTPGALVRLMAILRTAGRYFEQLSAHYHLMSLLKDLRLWSWQQLVDHPMQRSRRIGDFLQRVIGDVELINRWPLQVWMPWCYATIAAAIYLAFVSVLMPWLLPLLSLSMVLMLLVIPSICAKRGAKAVWQLQLLGTYRRSRFINLFGALITLTIRGHWQGYAKRLESMDNRQFSLETQIQTISITGRHLTSMVTAVTIGGCFYLASQTAQQQSIDGPLLAGLMFALLGLNELFTPLAGTFIGTHQTRVGMRRLNQLRHNLEPAEQTEKSATALKPITSFNLRQVAVKRPGAINGIQAFDLEIIPGEQIWLKGPSGCGKSTLLDAIASQIEIDSGEIVINQSRLDRAHRSCYQPQIGYLNQSPYIFNQSIAANLRLGDPDASDADIEAVLDAVGLGDWVKDLPYGAATLLGEQGSNISGGQARRLGLARVLLQKPDLMLLDEPFEGLDSASIQKIETALTGDYQPPMLVIASHLKTELLATMREVAL